MGFLSKVSILRCFYGYTQHHKSIFRGDTNEWLMNTPAKTSSIVLVARLTSVGAAGELSRRSRPVEVLPCMLRAKLQTMSSTSSQPIGGSFDYQRASPIWRHRKNTSHSTPPSFFCFFFSHFYFPASGQAVVTGLVSSSPPVLAFNFTRYCA